MMTRHYPDLGSASDHDNHTPQVGAVGLNYSSLFDMEVLSPSVTKLIAHSRDGQSLLVYKDANKAAVGYPQRIKTIQS